MRTRSLDTTMLPTAVVSGTPKSRDICRKVSVVGLSGVNGAECSATVRSSWGMARLSTPARASHAPRINHACFAQTLESLPKTARLCIRAS